MKKLFLLLIVFVTLIITTIPTYANPYVTLEDLNELALKYNFTPRIIENQDLTNIHVFTNLTKEQLETLILEARNQTIEPLYFRNDVNLEIQSTPELINEQDNIFPMGAEDWTWVTRVQTLSRTIDLYNDGKVKLNASVAAGYKFETRRFPGEASQTRNWSFTAVDKGQVLHTNPGVYELKGSITSNASLLSSTLIEQTYSGTMNMGIYIKIGETEIRIPVSDADFEGTIRYSITLVQ